MKDLKELMKLEELKEKLDLMKILYIETLMIIEELIKNKRS